MGEGEGAAAVGPPPLTSAAVAEPLGAAMGEQAEAAVITPAMLEEEEQLEAAGLEKERQMLEKVRGGPGVGWGGAVGRGRRDPTGQPGGEGAAGAVAPRREALSAAGRGRGRLWCGSFDFQTNGGERLLALRAVAPLILHGRLPFYLLFFFFF